MVIFYLLPWWNTIQLPSCAPNLQPPFTDPPKRVTPKPVPGPAAPYPVEPELLPGNNNLHLDQPELLPNNLFVLNGQRAVSSTPFRKSCTKPRGNDGKTWKICLKSWTTAAEEPCDATMIAGRSRNAGGGLPAWGCSTPIGGGEMIPNLTLLPWWNTIQLPFGDYLLFPSTLSKSKSPICFQLGGVASTTTMSGALLGGSSQVS